MKILVRFNNSGEDDDAKESTFDKVRIVTPQAQTASEWAEAILSLLDACPHSKKAILAELAIWVSYSEKDDLIWEDWDDDNWEAISVLKDTLETILRFRPATKTAEEG